MTHNEDNNQLIETDIEITVIVITFSLFKKVEERAMRWQKDPNQLFIHENYSV